MPNSPSIPFKSTILFLLFFLIIGAVYSPALYFNYVFHDDCCFWVRLKEFGFKQFAHEQNIIIGRYAAAWLIDLQTLFVHKVSDLKFLRFLAVLMLSGNAYLLLQQMRRFSRSDIQAFLVISAMFFLPGFADSVFHISNAYVIFSVLLACWSFCIAEGGKGFFIPAAVFLMAIIFYPSGAMFYWTMMGMYILFVRDRFSVLFRNNIIRFMTVGLTGLLIYAILIFFMHYFFSHKIFSPFYNPYAITPDWLGKFQWFFQEPIGNALNLWDIFPQVTTSIIVSGFIGFTALIALTKRFIQIEHQKRKNVALTYFWQLALFILIFFLTFLPNLAATANAAFYRCLIPLTSLIWLVLVWAIFQWMDIVPIMLTRWAVIALLSTIVVYAGIKTYHNVLWYRVLPSYIEYNVYKSMAEEIHLKKVNAIHVILPYHLSIERYDEFGVLSSHYRSNIYHLIYCAFKETEGSGPYSIPSLYVSYPEDSGLTELKEIYITKLPNGKWMGRDINKDNELHEIDYSPLGDTIDSELICSPYRRKIFSKRQDWYILNLNDIFRPSNYGSLIGRS